MKCSENENSESWCQKLQSQISIILVTIAAYLFPGARTNAPWLSCEILALYKLLLTYLLLSEKRYRLCSWLRLKTAFVIRWVKRNTHLYFPGNTVKYICLLRELLRPSVRLMSASRSPSSVPVGCSSKRLYVRAVGPPAFSTPLINLMPINNRLAISCSILQLYPTSILQVA